MMKYTFKVPDMSCGHCKAHIEESFKNWGKAASYAVDLEAKTITVETDEPQASVIRVIRDEGYTPEAV
ncbi:heavy-metal-associated domain-containing protein [Breznakiella homolactica]|uniref:Heavy-metal-associated domain-containing protein n=1 Tax=Breznakiella homolactica TaxID=2798577 RepID=A0A7T7XPH4_9SPIR|nr:heavy-metal-associated domain-containing protein [Breznakiella homolactica]QQO10062.1 heavy-metal-associated domain-containing protein [Breznakiella homolactica]